MSVYRRRLQHQTLKCKYRYRSEKGYTIQQEYAKWQKFEPIIAEGAPSFSSPAQTYSRYISQRCKALIWTRTHCHRKRKLTWRIKLLGDFPKPAPILIPNSPYPSLILSKPKPLIPKHLTDHRNQGLFYVVELTQRYPVVRSQVQSQWQTKPFYARLYFLRVTCGLIIASTAIE